MARLTIKSLLLYPTILLLSVYLAVYELRSPANLHFQTSFEVNKERAAAAVGGQGHIIPGEESKSKHEEHHHQFNFQASGLLASSESSSSKQDSIFKGEDIDSKSADGLRKHDSIFKDENANGDLGRIESSGSANSESSESKKDAPKSDSALNSDSRPKYGTNTSNISSSNRDDILKMLVSNKQLFEEERINCGAIINQNNSKALKRADHLAWKMDGLYGADKDKRDAREASQLEQILKDTDDCDTFVRSYGLITDSLTEEEENFPIAFSVLGFKDIEMFVRLIAAIYRPQNYFCLHVDLSAHEHYHKIASKIAGCFPNIDMAPTSHNITWGNWTIVQAEIDCMGVLYKYTKWKYFINLTGQEFPLKTNYELVKILKSYNGANDVDGGVKRRRFFRWYDTSVPGITAFQGSTHIAVNREFVAWVLFNDTSKIMQAWLRPTKVPDETFFATINHNPQLGIRGIYGGGIDSINRIEARMYGNKTWEYYEKPFFTRYKVWYGSGVCAHPHWWKRGVCVLSTGDLPRMTSSPGMFANKFNINKDPVVVSCLSEWIANKTLDFFLGTRTIDTSVYETSTHVTEQLL